VPSPPTPKPGSNRRKRYIKEEEMHYSTTVIKKLKPSRAAQRVSSRRWYHNNKISLSKKSKLKRGTLGATQLLNQNPDTDIDQLIQKYTPSPPVLLSILPTTTKSWTELLDQKPQVMLPHSIPPTNRTKHNKRKLEEIIPLPTPSTIM
jgi:hypothetical protein